MGLGAGMTGQALLTTSSAFATHAPATESEIKQWDLTTDVLIMGSGAAGISAAIDARRQGADVLVLEKFFRLSGSSGMSGGVCYFGGGTPIQKACGFSDTTEAMYEFIARSATLHPHLDKIAHYCENSLEHFDWMVAQGVPYKAKYTAIKGLPGDDSSLYYSGCEQNHPYSDYATPAPRGHVPAITGRTRWTGGKLLMEKLTASAKQLGVKIKNKTSGLRLITNSDGDILGLEVKDSEGIKSIRARKGVILSAGGFIHNREMVKRFAPELYDCSAPWGNAGDLGDGIMMGISAGGETLRMHQGFSIMPLYQPEHVLAGIVVNGSGQRFCAEDVYHAVLGHEMAFNQHGRAFLIADKTTVYGYDDYRLKPMAQAATINDLEQKLQLPVGALEHTLTYYNQHAAEGKDPLFNKKPKFLRPLTQAPFTAYDLNPKVAFYAAHTFGGLHTNVNSEVINAYGEAIPGLYAAGRTTSGLPSSPYIASGLSIGDCTYFGRRAGTTTAKRKV